MKEDAFGKFNPAVCFTFFIAAIVMGMCLMHPLFTVCSCLCAVVYLFIIKGLSCLKTIGGVCVLWAVITFLNPFFNTQGRHVLFYYFGNTYSLESLLYGFTLGGMVSCVLLWFSCYNAVMSSEKFIYLFGRIMPSISLVLSMVLRLIPSFRRRSDQIVNARAAIGMAGDSSMSGKEKLRNGATVIGALTNWALEGGIVSADSMRSRGYGTAKRTSYLKYRFGARNACLTSVLIFLICVIIFCAANGAASAVFVPDMSLSWFGNTYTAVSLAAYAIFLLIPVIIDIKELLLWQILRSRI